MMLGDVWGRGITANSLVSVVALHSLRDRLVLVQQLVDQTTFPARDLFQQVHDLRVATRRSLAALRLYRGLLKAKPHRALRRTLKKILETAGRARDLDVLVHRYEEHKSKRAKQLVRGLRKRRTRMQRRLGKLCSKLGKTHRLARNIDRILSSINTMELSEVQFHAWAKVRWLRTVETFSQSSNLEGEDAEALHRFRICGKELRYTMELLASLFNQELLRSTHEKIAELQEKLGRIHDHFVAIQLFSRWKDKGLTSTHDFHWKKLLAGEHRRLKHAIAEFNHWWTIAQKANLLRSIVQFAQ